MIKMRFFVWFVILFLLPSPFVEARFRFWQHFLQTKKAPDVHIKLYEEKGELLAQLQVKNKFTYPISLEKEKLGIGDQLTMEVFFILEDGKPLSPRFPSFKRPPPSADDFLILQPNESIQIKIHLNQAYVFRPGLHFYQVFYDASHSTEQDGLLFLRATAIPVFYKYDHQNSAPQYKLANETTVAETGTDSQKTAILDALQKQKEMIQQKLDELRKWDEPTNEKARTLFKIWFGKTDEASRKRIRKALEAMMVRNNDTKLQNFEIGSHPIAYAHVFGDDPTHMITLFETFFKAPSRQEKNSKPGVLCHEMSHFIDVAGTTDRSYGTKNSKQLALDDPEGAMNNADNFEYYLENVF